MFLFHVQGEGIGAEQMRREQMKNTERDLRTQKEDNERRHMGIKHRGEKRQTQAHTQELMHTLTDELTYCALQSL